jgi:hypothetical protein
MTRISISAPFYALAAVVLATACNDPTTYDVWQKTNICDSEKNCTYTSITPETFVQQLVSMAQQGQIAAGYATSKVLEDKSVTPGYFVIWDGARNKPVAVSEYYLYTIVNAGDFKGDSQGAYAFGKASGVDSNAFASYKAQFDQWASQYITCHAGCDPGAVIVSTTGTDANGNPNAFADGAGKAFQTSSQELDVGMQIADAQTQQTAIKVAQVSLAYSMGVVPATKIVKLSEKIEAIKNRGVGFTAADRKMVEDGIAEFTGITYEKLQETLKAADSGDDKTVSENVATISKNLEMPSPEHLLQELANPPGSGK